MSKRRDPNKRPAYDPGPKPDGTPRGFMRVSPEILPMTDFTRVCRCKTCRAEWNERELAQKRICSCVKEYDYCSSCMGVKPE